MKFLTLISVALLAFGVTAQDRCEKAYKNCFNGNNCVHCRRHVFDNVSGCKSWAANIICVSQDESAE